MKYNIIINQAVLADTTLDLVDGALLDYLHVYCNSLNEKIEAHRIRDDTGIWTWVDYGTILKDMPILRIKSTGALTPRIQRIEAEGFISTRREGNQKLFIKLNSKIDELFIKMNRPVHETKQSYSPKRTNYNTKDNTTKVLDIATQGVAGKEVNEWIEKFKSVNPSYQQLFRRPPQRAAMERLLAQHGADKLLWVMDVLPKTNAMMYFPTITTPLQLEDKLGDLIAKIRKENGNGKGSRVVTI
jgi:hypothetical protein